MTADTERLRLGLCLAAFGGMDLEAALAEATTFGPLCLDVPTDTTLGVVDARRCFSDSAYRDDVASQLDRAASRGWPVACVSNSRDAQLLLGPHGPHTDHVCPGSADEKRQHALQCAIGAIRLAERTQSSVVRLLVGCPDFARWLSWRGSDVSWADNIDEFYTRAEPLLHAAREAGLVVALEPHPKQVVYDRASAELLLSADCTGTLVLCVDPANLAAMGHDPVEAVRGWGAGLKAVHAKDLQIWTASNPPPGAGWARYGPGPPIRFRALGLGRLDWPGIVDALNDQAFREVLYVEHEDELTPRRQSITRSLRVLRELLPSEAAEGRTW